jgi:hypothetical protein
MPSPTQPASWVGEGSEAGEGIASRNTMPGLLAEAGHVVPVAVFVNFYL